MARKSGNNIQGITIEIGGDATKLEKALSGVEGKVKSTQAELKEVEKLLKLDPKNTEALAQKQQLLSKAISETKEKLDVLKTAEAQVEEQFRRGEVSEEQYRALKREIEVANLQCRQNLLILQLPQYQEALKEIPCLPFQSKGLVFH